MAPSGVLTIGAALVLRDLVQRELGEWKTIVAILAGAALSAWVAPPALVIASGAAFLLSELADMAVYTPLRQRRLGLAVLASGIVGAAVDSAVFLWLAFGSLTYLQGQIVGKLWASLAAFIHLGSVAPSRDSRVICRYKTPPPGDRLAQAPGQRHIMFLVTSSAGNRGQGGRPEPNLAI
jgi:uncharacterized PurR-regulated membrane protein YhhQ (DUF165 family)